MKVIKPTTVTPSLIISSTLQETEQAWSSSTAYAAGDIVYYGIDGGIYQALTANTNKVPIDSPLDWGYVGPTNKWALFDPQVSTPSTAQSDITLTIKTGDMQGIALLNLSGSLVSITVKDDLNGNTIYQSTQSLIGDIFDWYQFFFFEIETQRNQAIFVDLPMNYINTYTTINVHGTGTVSIGTCTFGTIRTLGTTQFGTTSGIIDYSVKQTDEFGETTFVRRAFSKRLSGRILVNNAELNRVQRVLYDLRAVPAVWFASENPNFEEALVVFGYYRDFSTDISYPRYSYCSLEIEGLI